MKFWRLLILQFQWPQKKGTSKWAFECCGLLCEFPAETRLTVYRRLDIILLAGRSLLHKLLLFQPGDFCSTSYCSSSRKTSALRIITILLGRISCPSSYPWTSPVENRVYRNKESTLHNSSSRDSSGMKSNNSQSRDSSSMKRNNSWSRDLPAGRVITRGADIFLL
jgi:hypothetical protein